MANYIILRNCPKTELFIDMVPVEIEGGFRGIRRVSFGFHHIMVKSYSGENCGFWTLVDLKEMNNDVIVKVYDEKNNSFIDDSKENVEKYTELALSRQMDKDLVKYPLKEAYDWRYNVGYMKRFGKIPQLHLNSESDEADSLTAFQYFVGILHESDLNSAIAEFQYAFVRMWVAGIGDKDPEAVTRWQEIIDIFYNATIEEIKDNDVLIISWISVYIKQLLELPDSIFEEDTESEQGNVVIAEVAPFVQKLVDSGDKDLKLEGLRLAKYFTERGYRV